MRASFGTLITSSGAVQMLVARTFLKYFIVRSAILSTIAVLRSIGKPRYRCHAFMFPFVSPPATALDRSPLISPTPEEITSLYCILLDIWCYNSRCDFFSTVYNIPLVHVPFAYPVQLKPGG